MFRCAGCGAELFDTDAKFESGTGWPSFDRARAAGTVLERRERTFGMTRTEILCARCGGHLGHVFPDGPTDTGLRYCVNSLSLPYEPESGDPEAESHPLGVLSISPKRGGRGGGKRHGSGAVRQHRSRRPSRRLPPRPDGAAHAPSLRPRARSTQAIPAW